MRVIGVVLIIVGVLMLVFNGFDVKKKENVADIGPIEINKTETERVDWPLYAGGIVAVVGVVLVVAGRKKR